ncbi:hypothetical protein MLD38_026471 [Melastoma candidum]|uniref:Uncharacterized protein n=1 Tax=Melastoma candidum TaxID=119954 RepID=A0ACB9NYH0_9MYRT|nr:hypothetical protein MLD38_026471 [Melastoma candidum]
MECDQADDRPPVVVVDISSDEGSPPIVGSNDDFDWLGELLYEDAVKGLAAAQQQQEDDDDDVVVIGESCPLDKSRKRKLESSGDRDRAAADDDDECLVLDGDPDKSIPAVEGNKGSDDGSDSEDLFVVGEKGQVACRDYPHPRHDCVKFPFNATSHEKHCDLCHCYVCDLPAPCVKWGTGMSNSDHCHATDKDGDWKTRRKDLKSGKSDGQVTFGIDNGIVEIVVPLPAQISHDGQMQSAAFSAQEILLSQHVMAHQAGQTIIDGSTPIPINYMPQNLPPLPAIYHQPSKTSPANIFPPRRPIFQRCSSTMENHSSSNICSGLRKQQSSNFKVGPPPYYAPVGQSHAINVVRQGGHHVRSSIRPQHASSVPRFNKTGIVYHPSASRAGCVSNNASHAPQVQRSGKFPRNTSINTGHAKITGLNSQLCTAFPSDIRTGHLSAASTLLNMVCTQSSGFCHPDSGVSLDARYVSTIYQQIEDAGALNQLVHPPHQNQGVPFHPEAETMDSATVVHRQQQPIQPSDHNLPQEFDIGNMTMNNNWWSESDPPQGPISIEPPAATVDTSALLFDFDTPWNGVTGS